jgi:hypothetical protein
LREAVHALLDDRLDASKGAKADGTGVIVKAINKVSCEDILITSKYCCQRYLNVFVLRESLQCVQQRHRLVKHHCWHLYRYSDVQFLPWMAKRLMETRLGHQEYIQNFSKEL